MSRRRGRLRALRTALLTGSILSFIPVLGLIRDGEPPPASTIAETAAVTPSTTVASSQSQATATPRAQTQTQTQSQRPQSAPHTRTRAS
jgi:hypothetical protein